MELFLILPGLKSLNIIKHNVCYFHLFSHIFNFFNFLKLFSTIFNYFQLFSPILTYLDLYESFAAYSIVMLVFFTFFHFFAPSRTFFIEGVLVSLNLFYESCLECLITQGETPSAILGPLVAILEFAGVGALQVVSLKKIQQLKTLKIAEKLLKNTHFFANIWGGFSSQDYLKISQVNQEVLGLTRKFLVKPGIQGRTSCITRKFKNLKTRYRNRNQEA